MLKSSVALICFILEDYLSEIIMGETEHLDFHDFWVLEPLGTLIYGFEYTKLLQKTRERVRKHFRKYDVMKHWTVGISTPLKVESL